MVCPDCTKGNFLPGEPTGVISTQGAYYSTVPMPTTKCALLLLTDAFGLPLKNCKILADRFAQRLNCDVWVPDLFDGKPLMGINDFQRPDRAGEKMTLLQWIRFFLALIPRIPAFIFSRPSVVDQRLSSFINAIQNDKKYEAIGAVGYCFGGSAAVRLGGTDFVKSIVICHPGRFSDEQLRAIKVPASWACAEDDMFWTPASRLNAEAAFAERKGKNNFVEYEFKDYKGTTHGFAARPNLAIPEIKEAYEGAFEQAVQWLTRTLPW